MGDIKKAAEFALKKALKSSIGRCASYISNALLSKNGGGYSFSRPGSAFMYSDILPKIGFTKISLKSDFEIGDIAVFQTNREYGNRTNRPFNPDGGIYGHGHVCIFTSEGWVSDFKQTKLLTGHWSEMNETEIKKTITVWRDMNSNPVKETGDNDINSLRQSTSIISPNGSPTSDAPLSEEPTGLKYFHFDPNFIERGIRLYKEYYNKEDIEDVKEDRGSGDLGFVPLALDIKFEGISGWVIYNKLKINQKILPPQYPKNFNFIITGISHDIVDQDWVTNIETLSVPDLNPKRWYKTAVLTSEPKLISPNNVGNQNISSDQNKYMKMVYEALISAGFNKNQSRILTAEIGRENSFNPNLLFGGHKDPHKGNNVGMISWQGTRRVKLLDHLQKQGLIMDNGKLVPSQQCLNAQARFIMWEINNDKEYLITKNKFLKNANVSYEEGSKILGTNYIRWRYSDGRYAQGHSNRNLFYQKISAIT